MIFRFFQVLWYSLKLLFTILCFRLSKKLPPPELIKKYFESLGATFIKFGQVLALRADFLPEEYCLSLLDLFDNVSPLNISEINFEIKKRLGKLPTEIFVEFESKPLASASFAQVHRARLLDVTVVVVKVQRPNIVQKIKGDLRLISVAAWFLDRFNNLSSFSWSNFAKEFSHWTLAEIDYQNELNNLTLFYNNTKALGYIVSPRGYPEFSNQHILVEDHIEGVSLNDILRQIKTGKLDREIFKRQNIDLHQTTQLIAYELARELFVDGFFHADPHPGNILLLPNNKIGFIDFGICGCAVSNQKHFFNFLKYMVTHDYQTGAKHLLRFTSQKLIAEFSSLIVSSKKVEMVDDFLNLLSSHFHQSIQDWDDPIRNNLNYLYLDYSSMFLQILKFGSRYRIELPSEMSVFLRALTIVGMVLKLIDNDFRMEASLAAFYQQYPIYKPNANLTNKPKLSTTVNNFETASEKFYGWINYLSEIDPALYSQVQNRLQEFGIIKSAQV